MRNILRTLLFTTTAFSTLQASAELLYRDFPPAPAIASCAKPDFTSYHRARNAESMIRSSNPELANPGALKPNFDGRYLLLRVPYMMGTDWLLVDCASGKFVKEVLSDGEAGFRTDSSLVLLKSKTETGWYRFTGTEFVKTEESRAAAPQASSPSSPVKGEIGALAPYEPYLRAFAPRESVEKCAPLKFDSYFRAQEAKSRILESGADLSKPNFAGHHLMLRVELVFETLWLVADCKTGLFIADFLEGEAHFIKSSSLFVMTAPKKAPIVHLLGKDSFIRKPDPTLKDPAPVENRIYRDEARTLIAALPNPAHRGNLEVLDLRLVQKPSGDGFDCEARSEDSKGKAGPVPVAPEACARIRPLIELFGPIRRPDAPNGTVSIEFIRCGVEQDSCLLRSRI